MTGESRQILVTVASAPGNAVLAVDDVILGAMAASSGTVPLFSSDARKAFGAAIGDAEKTGAGTLRVKRWRAGTTTDVNIPMTIMGDYTATAPYTCPKSSLILANARNKLVSQLLADPNFLTNDWKRCHQRPGPVGRGGSRAIPTTPPCRPACKPMPARCATAGPINNGLPIWDWAYTGLFLAEYYLSTGDANVLPGINSYTLTLAQSQSIYGTFGHGPSRVATRRLRPPHRAPATARSTRSASSPTWPSSWAKRRCSQAGRRSIRKSTRRSSAARISSPCMSTRDRFPTANMNPSSSGHSSNGKDPMCAVLFGLQADRAAETEYFTRMTIASYNGREYGHTGQGFSYLWSAMGANMGGPWPWRNI